MRIKRITTVLGVLVLAAVLGLTVVVPALAQTETPTPEEEQAKPSTRFWFGGIGCFGGGSTETYDAVAEALGLTPTELFEELHSGKTLSEIAEEQGVDLQALQDEANAARIEAMRERIAQAIEDGDITQEQADWLLEGLENGYMNPGHGFGFGRGGKMFRGGMNGMDRGMRSAPAVPALGSSSS